MPAGGAQEFVPKTLELHNNSRWVVLPHTADKGLPGTRPPLLSAVQQIGKPSGLLASVLRQGADGSLIGRFVAMDG